MRQQIAIALELLKQQWLRVPRGKDNKPRFKPLLFVIAVSIKDAEQIANVLRQIGPKYGVNKTLVVHNEQPDEYKKEAMELNKNPFPEYDAVVSILMLREGWDVRNISVELLFRKFTYKKVEDQVFSVYGPQVIGRGLRRMSKKPEDWESLFVIDHPILKHKWLWDNLKATEYPESLDPANIIVDEEKLPKEEETIERIEEGEKTLEEAEKLDISSLPPTPEPEEVVEPIYEWQKVLDDYKYDFHKMNISEEFEQVKSYNLDADMTTMEKTEVPEVEIEKIAKITKTEQWSADELKKQLTKQIHSVAHSSLLEYDRNPDQRQAHLVKVVRNHISKRLLGGYELEEAGEFELRRLWGVIDQVRDLFLRPELVEGILTNKWSPITES